MINFNGNRVAQFGREYNETHYNVSVEIRSLNATQYHVAVTVVPPGGNAASVGVQVSPIAGSSIADEKAELLVEKAVELCAILNKQ